MTQKELLYITDAINHEGNIIEIVQDAIDNLEDENLVSFMEEKQEEHITMREKLINLLEEKSNE